MIKQELLTKMNNYIDAKKPQITDDDTKTAIDLQQRLLKEQFSSDIAKVADDDIQFVVDNFDMYTQLIDASFMSATTGDCSEFTDLLGKLLIAWTARNEKVSD